MNWTLVFAVWGSLCVGAFIGFVLSGILRFNRDED